MSDDLRTGLVEAVAVTLAADDGWVWDQVPLLHEGYRRKASLSVDRMLGFLTNNGDSWNEAALAIATGDSPGYSLVDNFIQALSDSRDTGEKP